MEKEKVVYEQLKVELKIQQEATKQMELENRRQKIYEAENMLRNLHPEFQQIKATDNR